MRTTQLLKRSLTYYWRTNIVVVLGVATAVAVLAGALLIGHSVRASLREISSQRLGNTDVVISSSGFFREQFAQDLLKASQASTNDIEATCPMIAINGSVVEEASKRRAGNVRIYGVDERFWRFQQREQQTIPQNRSVLISEALAKELGANNGSTLLLRVEKPSEIPVESLHGRKDDVGKTIRANVTATLPGSALGDFSLQPQQGPVNAIFVSLSFLQRELQQESKVNTILIDEPSSKTQADSLNRASLAANIKKAATLEDAGIVLRPLQTGLSLETESKIINDTLAQAAQKAASDLSLKTIPVLSYLANSINVGDKSVPYSLVTALDSADFDSLQQHSSASSQRPIILNDWAAKNLKAKPGDRVSLEYYLWNPDGSLETKTADFALSSVVPISGLAADRDLVPSYPGITESENLSDWDPPFPIDLNKVQKQDEDYWHQYRTTPKAFIPLAVGQELWQSRFGKFTSLRIATPSQQAADQYSKHLLDSLDPTLMGLQVFPVRELGVEASRGATDFGEYFLYFSFFLVVSALLLAALFFKLGIEQRLREIGTLQAIGFSRSSIRKLFIAEGSFLAVLGSVLGIIGAIAYAALLMYGLRTWWVGAVGTTDLRLHISWLALILGAIGGVLAAIICIVLTLRRLGKDSSRSLITGAPQEETSSGSRRHLFNSFRLAIAFSIISLILLILGYAHLIPEVAGFFGAALVLLVASICFISSWLRRRNRRIIQGFGIWGLSKMGIRNASYRPGRTVLCVALIASAAFIIVAVDAFRRSGIDATDRKSGTGGFPLQAESLLPIVNDPNTLDGREALNLNNQSDGAILSGVSFTRFRVRAGDDTSCLNLYQTKNPRIVAASDQFIQSNRFSFQTSLATTAQEKENPWLLLNSQPADGAIPVIGDANSLTYVLHLKPGDELVMDNNGTPLRLRVVAALADSIFQSELLMSERNFLQLFPGVQGHSFFLIDTPNLQTSTALATTLEDRLSDFGFDVESTSERLASFHRVENTYLSTFQMLGGLGLVLGTIGMAAVLLRNVFERRRELALLRAVGYNSSHFAAIVITENVLMLVCGLVIGTICALLSIGPVFLERGGRFPDVSLGFLLLAVFLSGAIASLIATWAALRSPLLPALRAE